MKGPRDIDEREPMSGSNWIWNHASPGDDGAVAVNVGPDAASFRLRLTDRGVIKGGTAEIVELLGCESRAVEGTRLEALIHPDDIGPSTGPWMEVLASPDRSQTNRLRLRHADGGWRWFGATTWNALADPSIAAVVTELRDIHGLVEAEQALHASELGFRTLAESMPVGVAVLDEDGRVHFANHHLVSVLRHTGVARIDGPALEPGQVGPGFTVAWSELVDADFAAEVAPLIGPGEGEGSAARSRQVAVHQPDGTAHHLLVSASTVRNPGGRSVIVSVQDVSDEVRTTRDHDRLIQVVDEVDDVVIVVDLDGCIAYCNHAARQFLGPDAPGRRLQDFLTEGLLEVAMMVVEPTQDGPHRWSGDLEVPDRSGWLHTMATAVRPVVDRERPGVHIGITMRDVTAERAHARELAHSARHDLLTDLPNRLSLMESLETARHRGHPDEEVAVCFIDLDNLKIVNDGLGHSAGDRLLVAVADELRRAAAPHLVARFGGDEFVVLGGAVDQTRAMDRAERLLAAVEQVQVTGVASHISASIGVALSRRADLDPEGIIRDADSAMYAAKRAGRSRCTLFDEDLRQRASRRFQLETLLRDKLRTGGLDVHLQPVVALADGKVSGFEALSRWSEAAPDEFITVAEESGLIVPLGQTMLERTLVDAAKVRVSDPALAELRIGVNVSGRELHEPDFAVRTLAAIDASGIPASHIVLELTETVLIDQREGVDHAISRLRDAGISLALDDFGKGYSSLTYLRRYPIDILKLDVSYTQALDSDAAALVIADAMVSMANRLGIDVVAEGVETAEQLAIVADLGVKWVQGFLLGRPASVDDLLGTDLTQPVAEITAPA